ncbi:hypothetical protein ACFQGT_01810 [Natrialbaceae archaeon GCM10025810]|uniref:DUF7344 domain-containing protein n=1 Tax=Halovalidus salilacus TaxID=3075124 RepID=UPI0036240B0D
MKTDTSDVEFAGADAGLGVNRIFELLLEPDRRYALYHLSRKVGAVSLEEIAEQIALRTGEPTRERIAAVTTGLHHNHVPKLVGAGVVRYDRTTDTVERLPAATALDPYLELAVVDDAQAVA